MKYMPITVALLALIVVLPYIAGCGPSWPVQWKATEATKQAQGLVEDNLQKARPHADDIGKVHVDEAAGAARVVTTYVGTPTTRRVPIQVHTRADVDAALAKAAAGEMASPENRAAIEQAKRDLARAAPTDRDVALAIPQEIEESVMPWADLGIALVTIFAPVAGATALGYRKKFKDAMGAFEQTVEGVDNAKLSKKQKAALAKAQDRKAKKLVDTAQAKQVAAKKAA